MIGRNKSEMAGPPELEEKQRRLIAALNELGSVMIAYSGGVDSSFLLWSAVRALGPKRVIAATAQSPIYIEQDDAVLGDLPRRLGIRHIILRTTQMEDGEFVHNPRDRCYYCKRGVLGSIVEQSRRYGFKWVAEGSNLDDQSDYRPGSRAVREAGVRSPLLEAGLAKSDIRELARRAGLENWNAPAESCLATRFPHGVRITPDGLRRVRQSEESVKALGFHSVRVRDYQAMARVEVDPGEIARLASPEISAKVVEALKAAGYSHVALDLQGYRRGSLDESPPSESAGEQHE
jgi:uncharacterized protein